MVLVVEGRMRVYSPSIQLMYATPLASRGGKWVRGHICRPSMFLSGPYGSEYDAKNSDPGVH